MQAKKVVIRVPMVSGTADLPLSQEVEQTVQRRFDEEFDLIDRNVATLFDAIRLGSIRPTESTQFVDQLRSLLVQSKERLLSDVLRAEDAGRRMLDQTRKAFGPGRLGTDLASVGIVAPSHQEAHTILVPPEPQDGKIPFRRLKLETVLRYVDAGTKLQRILEAMEQAGYLEGIDPISKESIPSGVPPLSMTMRHRSRDS
jgi:hypothetical protein